MSLHQREAPVMLPQHLVDLRAVPACIPELKHKLLPVREHLRTCVAARRFNERNSLLHPAVGDPQSLKSQAAAAAQHEPCSPTLAHNVCAMH